MTTKPNQARKKETIILIKKIKIKILLYWLYKYWLIEIDWFSGVVNTKIKLKFEM